jgi:hypothetical protein
MPEIVFQQSIHLREKMRKNWPHLERLIASADVVAAGFDAAIRDTLTREKMRSARISPRAGREALQLYNRAVADGRYVAELLTNPARVAKKLDVKISDSALYAIKVAGMGIVGKISGVGDGDGEGGPPPGDGEGGPPPGEGEGGPPPGDGEGGPPPGEGEGGPPPGEGEGGPPPGEGEGGPPPGEGEGGPPPGEGEGGPPPGEGEGGPPPGEGEGGPPPGEGEGGPPPGEGEGGPPPGEGEGGPPPGEGEGGPGEGMGVGVVAIVPIFIAATIVVIGVSIVIAIHDLDPESELEQVIIDESGLVKLGSLPQLGGFQGGRLEELG